MIKSFGCSFFYGNELTDCNSVPSNLTWPALMAENLGVGYECYAKPGAGNLFILNSILEQKSNNDLFLINWTWIDRFDYLDSLNEQWKTLRPGENTTREKFYFKNLHSQYKDTITNLGYIKIAIDYLLDNNIKFIMTYMDYLLFDAINPNWHNPAAIEYLQDKIRPHLKDFNGLNFLDWARKYNYQISNQWHPLDTAHFAASKYWIEHQ